MPEVPIVVNYEKKMQYQHSVSSTEILLISNLQTQIELMLLLYSAESAKQTFEVKHHSSGIVVGWGPPGYKSCGKLI